jgi:hypothetical protein
MKGALQYIIVESGVQFVEGVRITMLRWVLHPTVKAYALDFYFYFFTTTSSDDIAIIPDSNCFRIGSSHSKPWNTCFP